MFHYLILHKGYNKIVILSSTFILALSCAVSYKPLCPEEFVYYNKLVSDSIEVGYNTKILNSSDNIYAQRKAKKKNVNFIGLRVENKSDKTINLSEDFVFLATDSIIIPLSVDESYNYLKQKPAIYYLSLLSVSLSVGSGGAGAVVFINPLSLVYAVPNSIIAGIANKNMKEEFYSYDYYKTVVLPGEISYSFLCFTGDKDQDINIYSYQGLLSNNLLFHHVNSIDSILYFNSDRYSDFDSYYTFLLKEFALDPNFKDIELIKSEYRNGNVKYEGLEANHLWSNNPEYAYKIGTWRSFYENGQLKEYIDYNLTQDKNGRYVKYSDEGEVILDNKYIDDRKIDCKTCEIEFDKTIGSDIIFRTNGEIVQCKITGSDLDKVYIKIKTTETVDSFIKKDQIKKIVYGDKRFFP